MLIRDEHKTPLQILDFLTMLCNSYLQKKNTKHRFPSVLKKTNNHLLHHIH